MDLLPHEIEEIINESVDATIANSFSTIEQFWHSDSNAGWLQLQALSARLAESTDVNEIDEPDPNDGQSELSYYAQLGVVEANRLLVQGVAKFLTTKHEYGDEQTAEELLKLFKQLVLENDDTEERD